MNEERQISYLVRYVLERDGDLREQQSDIRKTLSSIFKSDEFYCESSATEALSEKEIVYRIEAPVFADNESYSTFFKKLKKMLIMLERYKPHFTSISNGGAR